MCPKNKKTSNVVCACCGKKGHVKNRCFKLKREKKVTASVDKSNMVSAFLSVPSTKDFYLDSGTSNHMVNNGSCFEETKPCKTSIRVANNETITSKVVGSIKLSMCNQVSPLTLSDALFFLSYLVI